ncbi:MAG TPA: ZIP family metal transporter [Dermatophilaceae bacterium]|nr:ZIP family metal transporter [Dermatophilaceae bacterium]
MTPAVAFLIAVVAASATMLGWVITTSGYSWPPRAFGATLLLAALAMILISSLELLPSAIAGGLSVPAASGWALAGAFIVVALRYLARSFGPGHSRLSRSATLIAVAIGLHNVPEGGATVAAALMSVQGGTVTAVAVGLHNVPEGIAVAAPVMASGGSRTRAFWYTCIATGGEILGAVIALVFAEALTQTRVAVVLALVAGLMITLSLVEIVPSGLALLRRGASGSQARFDAGIGSEP